MGVGGGVIKNKANSVQFGLNLPVGTELGIYGVDSEQFFMLYYISLPEAKWP